MAISFKYKRVRRAEGVERKLPYIPVFFKKGFSWIQTMALLDSGADVSVMPKDFAELLGLEFVGEEEKANGIGGEVRVINSKTEVMIKKGHESYEFSMPVQVVLDDTKAPVIIGREGFFDEFVIEFNHSLEKIKLKRISKGLF
ncbi:MAG: retropepsin-like aspartic protease [Candidatus Pacearchaeota archaeon]